MFLIRIIFVIIAISSATLPANSKSEHLFSKAGDKMPFDFYPDMMCGVNCLWQVSRTFGKTYSLGAIANITDVTPKKGTTVMSMVKAAQEMGLQAEAVKINIEELQKNTKITILLLDLNRKIGHYVIFDKIENGKVRLLDSDKFRTLTLEEFNSIWNGYAILVGEKENFTENNLFKYSGFATRLLGIIILAIVVLLYSVKYIYIFVKRQTLRH